MAHGTGIKTLGESPKMGMSFKLILLEKWKHKPCTLLSSGLPLFLRTQVSSALSRSA